jgi:RNA polymerase sigma factor (sigma-70 family)
LNDLEEYDVKTIKIKDYYGIYQEIPVSDELYEEFRNFHREEDRQNKYKNYHGCYVPFDDVENDWTSSEFDPLTEEIIRQEEIRRLYRAIAELTPLQRKRIYMLMDDMNYTEIAHEEGISIPSVRQSVELALKKLRRLLTE